MTDGTKNMPIEISVHWDNFLIAVTAAMLPMIAFGLFVIAMSRRQERKRHAR